MFHNVGGIKVSGGEVQRSPFFNPALIGKTMPAFIVVQSDRVVTTVGPGVLGVSTLGETRVGFSMGGLL